MLDGCFCTLSERVGAVSEGTVWPEECCRKVRAVCGTVARK